MHKSSMSRSENISWLSTIGLILMSLLVSNNYMVLLLFWSINIIIKGNIKRITSSSHRELAMVIRRGFYVIPYVLPFVFVSIKIGLISNYLLLGCILAIVLGIVFIIPQFNNFMILSSNEVMSLSNSRTKTDYLSDFFLYIASAVSEEFFFRGFIISYVGSGQSILISIVVSSLLFILSHFGTKWGNEFKLYDLVVQVLFSIMSALMYIIFKSIIPSILFHIVYNSPRSILCIKSYYYHHYKKLKNKILQDSRTDKL